MKRQRRSFMADFREFFFRGLAIVLPTILTIWILAAVYNFVDSNIANPINSGVKQLIIKFTPWPDPDKQDYEVATENLTSTQRLEYNRLGLIQARDWLTPFARQASLERHWNSITIGNWVVSNVFGLIVAIIIIYAMGLMLGSYLGKRIYRSGEQMFKRLPIIKMVYPSVKQVTDFLVGSGDEEDEKINFSKVVAVEYPRKGLWSIGLVTGDTMLEIKHHAGGQECITVFIPSSPTPFTGYVITVPKDDTIDMPITVDQALRFTVSGGVIVPESQQSPKSVKISSEEPETGSNVSADSANIK